MKMQGLGILFVALSFFSAARAAALDCGLGAGSLPNPIQQAGTEDPSIPIKHIVVIMQENHSFDNYFGKLNQSQFYGKEVDGVTGEMTVPDREGKGIKLYHAQTLCVPDVEHSWNAMHRDWNNGRNDGFVRTSGVGTLAYFDQEDIPYYYALANQFAVADRYFSSALTPTFPNRYFLYAGTSFGHTQNDLPTSREQFTIPTIFDRLNDYGISWKYYSDGIGYLNFFGALYLSSMERFVPLAQYYKDLEEGTLPQVVFVDAEWDTEDEHPAGNIQVGQSWVAQQVQALMSSQYWSRSALFMTYDEGGGFFDHVPPPRACVPDSIQPMLAADSDPGEFDRYGFRVPFVVVSPFAKHHYVSHRVYDHGSVLKFIETKFNLPALTARDANADGLLDFFDFDHPVFAVAGLPSALPDRKRECSALIR